ncbi:MAG: 30S ribosomal protein S27ae [Candidatus Lokiarchaeota archaeon]|nr:30S ribosomal protein S27ae [Candidatus Lokiarchaeota archaeon]
MADKRGKTRSSRADNFYEIKDGKLVRKNKFCPRCGSGIFMAEMYDRRVCGRCGFTEFKKK